MILDPPFIKKTVLAGDPVTAQAWNDIVNAISAVYNHIEASEAASVKVQIANAGIDLSSVRVTATRDDGISTEAVRPVPPSTLHTFPGLAPGSYTIRAEAPGFTAATAAVVVASNGVLDTQNITLTKLGSFMPMTFGMTLTNALAQLATLSIAVSNVVDVTGTAVPVASPGAAYGEALVLMQFPAAGVPVSPGESAQLVISAALTAEASIEMPSLTGLTLAEASKALEALGLKVGKSFTKKVIANF
jgi:hypothetical protein